MFKKIKKKFFPKEKQEEQEIQEKFIRPEPRPPCGGAYWTARSRELWKNQSGKNDVTPSSRMSKSLYYKGSRIIELHRLSFGLGYEITLETDESMRISDEEWLENVYVKS